MLSRMLRNAVVQETAKTGVRRQMSSQPIYKRVQGAEPILMQSEGSRRVSLACRHRGGRDIWGWICECRWRDPWDC